MMMKALSIQQPWAFLIISGQKDIENRSWKTNLRGKILIHAGRQFDIEGYNYVRGAFSNVRLPAPVTFQRGGIIGMVELADCVDHSPSQWFTGPWGFVLQNAKGLPFIPYPGKLGFFNVKKGVHDFALS